MPGGILAVPGGFFLFFFRNPRRVLGQGRAGAAVQSRFAAPAGWQRVTVRGRAIERGAGRAVPGGGGAGQGRAGHGGGGHGQPGALRFVAAGLALGRAAREIGRAHV